MLIIILIDMNMTAVMAKKTIETIQFIMIIKYFKIRNIS